MAQLTDRQTKIALRARFGQAPPAVIEPTFVIDRLRLGHVQCDFMRMDTFRLLANNWLKSTDFHHVVTLNPEMVLQAESDLSFRQAVNAAQVRVPDGAGLIWARWYIRSQFWSLVSSLLAFSFRTVERVPGVELVDQLAALCEQQRRPMYLLGGTATQVKGASRHLRQRWPRLEVYAAGPHSFELHGPTDVIEDIQRRQPAVLLVAYGAPKQTTWIEANRHQLPSVRIAVGVGGAFAILSEERPRAPRWLQKLNMEWLWRLLLEPSRLPRIWRATVSFPRMIKQQKEAARQDT